uniref:F-box domain-containing protein n=1 Tax=Leersia perrieri TaxID=77586 RepID=A0A0D9VNZ5_9ORYZ
MPSSRYQNRRPAAALAACGRKRAPAVSLAASRSTRRRRTSAGADSSSSSWASLHEDLVELIARRVLASDPVDYIRFRAVCARWRSTTSSPRGRGIVDERFHRRRWMMLPEGHGLYPGHGKLRGFVRFFNLSTGDFVRVHLPLFRDHCVLDSVEGLLLLQRDHDSAIRLLHPFTGDILDFPPLETLLRSTHPPQQVEEEGTEPWLPPPRLIAKLPAAKPDTGLSYHLVECDSEILAITITSIGIPKKVSVYRLTDLMLGRTVPVTSIGGNALFIGKRNLCVRSKAFPTIVGDTIVFVHINELYLAQYHLKSGTLLPASDGSIIGHAIPSPRSIIYHIHTCCYRQEWNKGCIRYQGKSQKWRVKRKWRHGGIQEPSSGGREVPADVFHQELKQTNNSGMMFLIQAISKG